MVKTDTNTKEYVFLPIYTIDLLRDLFIHTHNQSKQNLLDSWYDKIIIVHCKICRL